MRTEIGVEPWAHMFMPYLDGEPLQDCTMADEELGCAEVFANVVVTPTGARHRLDLEKRMVFGHIEDRPIGPVARRIKENPEQAQAIWDEYYAALKAEWAKED